MELKPTIPLRHHVFVCMNRRPEGHPKGCCHDNGSGQVVEGFFAELGRWGLSGTVRVTRTLCMGVCWSGPTVVVYPEGVWYGKVQAEDVPEIVESHLKNGEPVSRLRIG